MPKQPTKKPTPKAEATKPTLEEVVTELLTLLKLEMACRHGLYSISQLRDMLADELGMKPRHK